MLMIVGEALGREEEEHGKPFVGPSGKLLRSCLSQVGISFDEAHVTNVFNFRPKPSNDISNLCGAKLDGILGWPALVKGKFVRKEYASELDRLLGEIDHVQPTLILALGATASWALLRTTGIKSIRGAPLPFHRSPTRSYKVLPTYHPAAVLREWKLRPILLADLHKARREMDFPQLRRPSRKIWIEPSLADLDTFEREHILRSPQLSIDIETAGEQITCVGFAPTKDIALVVPFVDMENKTKSYWSTLSDELKAWDWVRRMCQTPIPKTFQNGLYDMNFLWTKYGITVTNASDDTMLMHHAMQPEMQKGLGFLGSIYTDEASWKFMRAKHSETIKRED